MTILNANALDPILTGATRDALNAIDQALAEWRSVDAAVPGHANPGVLVTRALELPSRLAGARATLTALETETQTRRRALVAFLADLGAAPETPGTAEARQQAHDAGVAQQRETELGQLERQLEGRARALADAEAGGLEVARRVVVAALTWDARRLAGTLTDDVAELARRAARVLGQLAAHETQREAAATIGAALEDVPTIRLPREALRLVAEASVTLEAEEALPPPGPVGRSSWFSRGRPPATPAPAA